MKKYVVLSVNDNPDYKFFTPLTLWAWQQFGWEPVLFYCGNALPPLHATWPIKPIEGYKTSTIAQVSRLYAACGLPDDAYIMTGDIDMIPLSDYWKPHDGITVWGHDLTDYTQYPMCYIGMTGAKWKEVMYLETNNYEALIARDLRSMPKASNSKFEDYWFTDQELITARLKPHNPRTVNRGRYENGYARGRVDRGAWTLNHKEFIDAHLHHQIHHVGREDKFEQVLRLLIKIWPQENFGWFVSMLKNAQ